VSETISMFIGFDQAESVAYHTFEYSIQRRSSAPVNVTPLRLSQLRDVHNRPRHPMQSNEFSFSRWLVPYLAGYEGWAIFADCDMLCRADIKELWDLRDERYAVQVVKHDYHPTSEKKYLDQTQTRYEKKNWSSVMLMNCSKCKALTTEYVNTASGLDLHQFKWLGDDALIGELPVEWNYLVNHNHAPIEPKIIHFTEGGPYFTEYRNCEYSDEFFREYYLMIHCEQLKK